MRHVRFAWFAFVPLLGTPLQAQQIVALPNQRQLTDNRRWRWIGGGGVGGERRLPASQGQVGGGGGSVIPKRTRVRVRARSRARLLQSVCPY